jgi:hypothetical protein
VLRYVAFLTSHSPLHPTTIAYAIMVGLSECRTNHVGTERLALGGDRYVHTGLSAPALLNRNACFGITEHQTNLKMKEHHDHIVAILESFIYLFTDSLG